jgi:hypothetical protein
MNPERTSNELILNPGEYAFQQDKTTGNVQTHVCRDPEWSASPNPIP